MIYNHLPNTVYAKLEESFGPARHPLLVLMAGSPKHEVRRRAGGHPSLRDHRSDWVLFFQFFVLFCNFVLKDNKNVMQIWTKKMSW